MTDLQLSLLAAAGVFIAGVFTYNKIQEYKAKKSVERAFSTDHDDVLMRTGGEEPQLAPASTTQAAPHARQEPSFSLDDSAPGVAGGEASAAAAALGALAADFTSDDGALLTASEDELAARANAASA